MNIVHVGYIENRPDSGVAKVVPCYLSYQSKYANVALLNYNEFTPENAKGNYPVIHPSKDQHDPIQIPMPFSKVDLVVFHEVYRSQFLKLYRYLLKNNIPYIITPHGSLTREALRRKVVKKFLGNFFLFNSFIKNARAIHFLSESERNRTTKFRQLRSFVRNNGTETLGLKKKDFNKDRLDLIYVGRLEIKTKGIDRILEAAKSIKRHLIKERVHIRLFGTGSPKEILEIQKLIKKYDLTEVVTLGDGLFGENKIREILSNDCFIQLSRTEGQPLGIIEAMDIGMPCIITEGTTFRNIAEGLNAAILAPNKPAEIAQTILDIRAGKYDLRNISVRASEYVKNDFDWNKVSKLMIHDYRKILARAVTGNLETGKLNVPH